MNSRRTVVTRQRLVSAVPWLALLAYYACSLLNLVRYLQASAVALSGETYSLYLKWQVWINPFIRLPNELAGFPGGLLERWLLEDLMVARPDIELGYFLYSQIEIVALDFVLGGLVWVVLLKLGARFLSAKTQPRVVE